MHWNGLWRGLLIGGACLLGWAAPASASFSLVASPNAFTGDNVLSGVSAASPTDAWAVGALCCAFRHSGIGTLTEHWNGAAWSVLPSPDTALNDDELFGVADLGPGNAWAVGLVKQAGFKSGGPLAIHWNGTAWSTSTLPSGLTGTLRAVSADAASDVWAVGDDAQGHALVLHGNGTSWATSSVPVTRAAQLLQGVRAFSPSDVLTGGPIPIQRTLAQRWNGTSWIPQVSANSGTTDNLLEAASRVPGASFVWAVGFRLTSANVDQTLIERGAS